MIYHGYQTLVNAGHPTREFAAQAMQLMGGFVGSSESWLFRTVSACYEQVNVLELTHVRPQFGIQPVKDVSGEIVSIEESVATRSAFCHLVKFRQANDKVLPKILLVAPMSGHFATLLRGTVQVLVQDHEVYLTDWLNIRDVPLSEGQFGLDEYTDEIIKFLRFIGPKTHLIGVCQPTVSCLVATSVMAEMGDAATPASMILMAGPIDARISPTEVNHLAMTKPIEWFKSNLIGHVPSQFSGYAREVYPGFIQLSAFLNMNLDRHRKSLRDMFDLRMAGDDKKADQIRDFYKEYFAIMDLSADFYLETVDKVFQRHLLPKGELTYRGELVRPEAIRRTFLLTIEGMRDDICGVGQTLAAQDLCSRIPPYMKTHHLQAGVGHYGVFSGKRWAAQIYPVVRNLISSHTGT